MSLPLLDVKKIFLEIDSKYILEDISFQVNSNQIITIIGPNGSGKTSLIKIIIGLINQTSGEVVKKNGLKIGYVPQKFVYNKNLPMSVARFVDYQNNSYLNDQNISFIESLIDINKLFNKQVSSLSGGELQKVLLFRALLSFPDILILDEPTQGVDIQGQLNFYSILSKLRDKFNLSILIVSHDLHFVMKNTDIVICLNNHICCIGKPEEISQNEHFNKIFGENISNIISLYQHKHNHTH